jgi:hypothetical protein
MIKLSSVLFFGEGGLLSLRGILSSRVVASTIMEKVGTEIVNDNIGMEMVGYFAQQCIHCGSRDFVSYGGLLLFVFYLKYGWKNDGARIGEIDGGIGRLRKFTERFIWVVFLVFAKNVENAI